MVIESAILKTTNVNLAKNKFGKIIEQYKLDEQV
jgi:hypothetical protein